MKIPKDDLLEILDDLFAPFRWGYYSARMHMHLWHLQIRCRCSRCILLAQQRNARREAAFCDQKVADAIETIDPQIRPVVERSLQLSRQLLSSPSLADDDYQMVRAEYVEVEAKLQDYYNDDWPDCFNPEYRAGLSARVVDCLCRYALPVIDHDMPWSKKEQSNA